MWLKECTHQTQAVHIPPEAIASSHQASTTSPLGSRRRHPRVRNAQSRVLCRSPRAAGGSVWAVWKPLVDAKIPADRIDSYQVRVCTPPIQRIVVGCCWQSSHVFPCRRWISSCNIKQRSLCFRSLCFHYEDPLYTGFTTVQRFNSVLPVNTFTPKVM